MDLASALVDRSLLRLTATSARRTASRCSRPSASTPPSIWPHRLRDESETRARHAEYYQDLAEATWDVLRNAHRDELLDRLDRELPNFRAAIAWSLEAQHPETGLRIAAALRDFWHMRNHLLEGRRALAELLQRRSTTARRRSDFGL